MTNSKSIRIDPLWSQLFPSGLRKGDRRKAQIIETVIDLVSEGGFENLSFDRIAQKVGMTKSQVAYHYRSKDEMLARSYDYVLHHAQKFVIAHLQNSTPGLPRLLAYIQGNMAWFKSRPEHVQFILEIYGRATYESGIRKHNQAARLGARDRISGILKEALDLKPEELQHWAYFFHDLLTGAMIELLCNHGIPAKNQIAAKSKTVEEQVSAVWKSVLIS